MDYKEILSLNNIKLWLVGQSGSESLEDLKDCLEEIRPYFNGLLWAHHGKVDSEEFKYLKSLEGEGEVFENRWLDRMNHARNCCIWSPKMRPNDIFITIDVMEKLKPYFFDKFDKLLVILINNSINGLYLGGKHFLFFYNEDVTFVSSPHCGVQGISRAAELTQIEGFQNISEYFENMRDRKRDKHICIPSFLRYYFYPCSNHVFLSIENKPDLIRERQITRKQFLSYYYQKFGRDLTWQVYGDYVKLNNLEEKDKEFINKEIILNNYYRYHILGHRFTEMNDWEGMIKI